MKPEDVMRALECCTRVLKDALTLLREKDAEIERLQAQNETLEINNKDFKYRIYELSRDNEEWEHENNDLECDNDMLRERITEIKADTVTKMQKRLKEHLEKPEFPWDSFTVAEEVIDQIAKEMLEGK